ncbi:MAG: 4'-phosphopantetheinyl transferase superfamily protein [Deltaproteobacteria bacterium]|nr:4'-phosphopantetheinyl transferase superfamily protein [Deltaproteobacteria bacterium]
MPGPLPSWCAIVPTPFPDVRVHRLDVAAARGDYARLAPVLTRPERERAALFRVSDDRIRFVVTRAALRLLLAEAGLGPPEALAIVADANGKPALRRSSPLRFNVAHSGEVALIALADGRDVGVDVEVVRARDDLHGVAARFFAVSEIEALGRLAGAAYAAAFHRCWARKEACVKAAGAGLRAPLAAVVVGIEPRPGRWAATVARGGAPRAFELADVAARPGYAAAVAVEAPAARVDSPQRP